MYTWEVKSFNDFSLEEFYQLIALRIEVFVIEQDCPYQELDGKDQDSTHVVCKHDGKVVATTRIVKPGFAYPEPAIGRVVISAEHRGKGLGHQLMKETMDAIRNEYGDIAVKMSAQQHLVPYYGRHGFKQTSEMYLEDDIPHVEMLYTPAS